MKNLRTKIFVPAFAAAALLLSACEFSLISVGEKSPADAPHLFVLSVPETPADAQLPRFAFSRISLPSYLDTPQIVTRRGNEIARSGTNFWGEPLSRAVSRTLALHTSIALGKIFAGKTSGEFPSVRVAIERLDGTFDGNVEILANYRLQNFKGEQLAGVPAKVFSASVPVERAQNVPAGSDACAAYVRAIDTALEKLAEDIAKTLAAVVEEKTQA